MGNPYPSAIEWKEEYANQFEQIAVYIYDSDIENYIIIEDDDIIPTNQGFFAKVKSANNGEDFTFRLNLEKGVYFVRISGNNINISKKIIIN